MDNKQPAKQRLSNMELARIVAMLMIVIGHFILTYGLWNGSDFICRQDVTQPVSSYLYVVFFGLCIVGVNVFILVSGYFTIHLSWKSFLSYYLLCIFYNAAVFLINTFMFDSFSWKALVKVFLVDKTVNWFFRAYFWLMLISPLLNKALEHLSLRELRIGAALLLFLNCFSGFVLHEYNTNGFNVYNFVFLYVMGNWIRKESYTKNVSRGGALVAYFGGCLLTSLVAIFILMKTDMSIQQIFAYNNPLIVFASAGLVLFFSRLRFTSKAVNLIASTVVATLFVQHIFFMVHPSLKTSISTPVAFLIVTPLLFVIAFFVEYPRRKLADSIIDFIIRIRTSRQSTHCNKMMK